MQTQTRDKPYFFIFVVCTLYVNIHWKSCHICYCSLPLKSCSLCHVLTHTRYKLYSWGVWASAFANVRDLQKSHFFHRPERNNIPVKSVVHHFQILHFQEDKYNCTLEWNQILVNYMELNFKGISTNTHTLHIKLSHVNQFSFFHISHLKINVYIQVILLSGLCVETISQ